MRWQLSLFGLLIALAACAGEEPTQVLVIVDSDLPAGSQPETVELLASLDGVHMARLTGNVNVHGLPLSFALLHGGGALGPLTIRVEGKRGQQATVARDAELQFVKDKIVVLRMDLYAGCVGVSCEAQNTCTELGCVATAMAGDQLLPWRGDLGTLPAWRGGSISGDAGLADAHQNPPLFDAAPDAGTRLDASPFADALAHNDTMTIASLKTCAMFPGNSVWQVNVSGDEPSVQSDTYLNTWGSGASLSLQFGVDTGVIWASVPDAQPTVSVELAKPNIRANWPVPLAFALGESPASRLVVVNTDKCVLYEAAGCQKIGNSFACESGGAVALSGNWVRQPGSVMAQDSALALLPGLVRVEEVRDGAIDHALSMTMSSLQRGFVSPALNHLGGTAPSPDIAPMGVRLRLRATYLEAGVSAAAKVVIRALKTHGALVTHRGDAFGLQGERSADWAQLDLQDLTNIKASDFEVLSHGVINL